MFDRFYVCYEVFLYFVVDLTINIISFMSILLQQFFLLKKFLEVIPFQKCHHFVFYSFHLFIVISMRYLLFFWRARFIENVFSKKKYSFYSLYE